MPLSANVMKGLPIGLYVLGAAVDRTVCVVLQSQP